MLALLTHHLQVTATRTAHTAVLGLGAGICLFIGMGFLTAAAWLFLASVTTPIITTLILGGLYAGIGFIILVVMSMRSRARARERAAALAAAPAAAAGSLTSVIAAFLSGMSAGKRARF